MREAARHEAPRNELTMLVGRTIVNSFGSEPATASSIEYRRSLLRNVDWTIAWLDEGDNSMILRNGLTTQLWLADAFLDDRLVLGAGGGVYRAVDAHPGAQPEKGGTFYAGVASMTAGYRIRARWRLRATWSRIITDYDRDTDVILGGIGYLF